MKIEIKIPAMGESISEATVGQIIKASGSMVNTDDEILELETDKVNQVLYAPQKGILTLQVKPGDTVQIGQVIGFVDSEMVAVEKPKVITPPKVEPTTRKSEIEAPSIKEERPSIRKSREEAVAGVQTETPILQTTHQRETRTPMSRIRKVIAKKLVEAQQNSAMLTTINEVDMTTIIELRNHYKDSFQEKYGVKLGFMSFFVKAAVSALKAVPEVNSYIDKEEMVHREYYDIGIAVGTEKGLIVPVVRDCDRLSFAEIEAKIANFATLARGGKLAIEDLQGGGFTITNGGVYGSLLSTPILNPPQSGILGMHKIEKRPIVIGDEIKIRSMMYLALSYDHRVVDGKEAVTFLVHLKDCLEDPVKMLLFEKEV